MAEAAIKSAGLSGGTADLQNTTVFINYVPKMTFKKLRDYLEKSFDSVSKVVLRSRHTPTQNYKSNYALVTFTTPESANRAICVKVCWPNGKRISVKKCLDKIKTIDIQQTFLLDTLAPDYLFHIYQYLAPIDIANASECSEYLSNFAEANIYKKYEDCHIFDTDSKITYTWIEFKRILHHFGKHFKRMTLDANQLVDASVRHFAQVLKECSNLDELRVLNFIFDSVKALRKEQCSVRHLSFESTCIDHRWRELLKLWPKVTAFTIHRFSDDKVPVQIVGGIHALEQLTLVNGLMNSNTLFKSLQKHKNSIRKLSLIEMNEFSDNRYKGISQMLPKLEHLQISVQNSSELAAIVGMNIKFLQLLGPTNGPYNTEFVWSLSGLPLLEELDLVEINGSNIRIAANFPTLRVLSIQNSSINKEHGFPETIAKLPNLQHLTLRRCVFCVDELLQFIETGNLIDIELDHPPQTCTLQLLKSLIERSTIKTSNFQMRIIVDATTPDLVELCSKLAYVNWVFTKNHKLVNRFDRWDKILDEKEMEQMDMYGDYDDLDEYDDDYYDTDDEDYDPSDTDEYDELFFHHMNENGLGLGNAILDDIFNNMF